MEWPGILAPGSHFLGLDASEEPDGIDITALQEASERLAKPLDITRAEMAKYSRELGSTK